MEKTNQKIKNKKKKKENTSQKIKIRKSSSQNNTKIVLPVILLSVAILCILAYVLVGKKNRKKIDEVNETINEMVNIETSSQVIPSYQTIPSGIYFDNISERATMDVSFKDKMYYFEVNWANSASENMRWTFSGKYEKFSGIIPYDNAKCTYDIYDENGNVTDERVIFDNGKGVMKFDNNKLYWDDNNSDKVLDAHYNGIFEMPKDTEINGFTNTYNITNNYYSQPIYPQQGYMPTYINPQFCILRYDRNAIRYSNGAPMVTRIPIIGCNYQDLADRANNIIPNAYDSISKWVRNNISFNRYQDYFLNYAQITSSSPNLLVLTVNCSLQKKGVLSEHMTFRVNLKLDNNWYEWDKITDLDTRRVH